MKWYFYHNRKLRELMNRLVLKVTPNGVEPASEAEKELIDRLRYDFLKIGKIVDQGNKPSEQIWINNMNRLSDLVLHEEPRTFLHWDVIQKAMFITNSMYILIELSFLKRRHNWLNRWKSAIKEDKIGSPIPYWSHPSSSGNLIHHAYHIAQFEYQTESDIQNLDYVVECGGGYGSMCRLFRNLGFKGTYVIFDLPHFSALQKYYLQSLGITLREDLSNDGEMGVRLCRSIDELREFMGLTNLRKSLFLATWSLSETPLDFRLKMEPLFQKFNYLFFAYQSIFEEVDNRAYFNRLQNDTGIFKWRTWEVKSLPTHYYTSGVRCLAE